MQGEPHGDPAHSQTGQQRRDLHAEGAEDQDRHAGPQGHQGEEPHHTEGRLRRRLGEVRVAEPPVQRGVNRARSPYSDLDKD